MIRVFVSTVIGVVVGVAIGLFVGWVAFPTEYVNSVIPDLAPNYRDEYTVMIASGYLADRDVTGAIERLRLLGVDNVPVYVQETAERFITTSQDVDDIRRLVALAEGLGRLTPPMESFRQLSPVRGTP